MCPRVLAGAAAAWLVALPAHALEYGFGVGYGARYTDNALRRAQDPVSDVEHNLSGTGNISVETARWDVTAAGGAVFRYYSQDSFEPSSVETFNGGARYTFLPDRVTWTINDALQSTRINALLSTTPDNVEQTNRFSTGPSVTFRASSRNTIGMLVLYENDWYEVSSALSNDRGIGELNWRYRLTEPVSFVTRYQITSVRYRDNIPGTDFVQDTFTAGIEGRLGSTTTYRLEAGPARIRRDLQEEITTRVGTAQLTRQTTIDSGISVSLSSTLSDSGRVAQRDPTVDPLLQVTGVNPGRADSVHTRSGNIGYYSTLGWLKYRFAATVRDDDYQTSNQDVLASGGGVILEYAFTPRLTWLASGNFTRSDYDIIMRIDDDTRASVGFQFQLRRHWAAALSLLRFQRDSTDATQSYAENSVLATISYRYESLRIGSGN